MILYLLCEDLEGGCNPIGIYVTLEKYKEEARKYYGQYSNRLIVFRIELNAKYNEVMEGDVVER